MKNFLLRLVFSAFCFVPFTSYTQTDSTHFDLGKIRLNKDFTQFITIKAADLEKIPFSNLDDAVKVWFYGHFSAEGNLVYVVDGNRITDINIYSIYDIEEITLVQNALVNLNGAVHEQQLVLVTTKKDKTGINVNGGSFLVNHKEATGLFHQYYFSANKKINNTNFGISAQYIRDISPAKNDTFLREPLNFDRFKLRGAFNTKINYLGNLSAYINYAPQVWDYKADTLDDFWKKNTNHHSTNELFNGGVNLNSKILKGLVNNLSANFNTNTKQEYVLREIYLLRLNPDSMGYYRKEDEKIKTISDLFLLRNNLSYHITIDGLTIAPALNFLFRFINHRYNFNGIDRSSKNFPSFEYKYRKSYNRLYIITPSIGVNYRSIFNLEVGLVKNISTLEGWEKESTTRNLPFFNSTIDVIKLAKEQSSSSLKLFLSYIKSEDFNDSIPSLSGLNNSIYDPFHNQDVFYNLDYRTSGNSLQLGSTLSLKNDLIRISYNNDKRYYSYQTFRKGWNNSRFEEDLTRKTSTHRLGIDFRISESVLMWRSGVSLINKKSEMIGKNSFYSYSPSDSNLTSFTAKMFTGGIVNRLAYKNISLGVDFMYLLGERRFTKEGFVFTKALIDSFVLQNLYLAYSYKNIEFYLSTRNIAESAESNLTDHRKFYGLGFKVGL
ncbi:MAG TPA: hypothetical protein VD908_20290 [Cytophagales bacterium]|nr:hypothetical protein [Cytophagales bacterium]